MRIKHSRRWFQPTQVLSLLLGATVLSVVCPASAKDLLWRVRSPTTTVYLLGSIHVLRSSDYPLPASFDPAFQLAQRAVFEINLDEASSPELTSYILSKAAYPSGQTIRGALTAAAYQKLQNFAVSSGLPAAFFDPYRPWFASAVVDDLQNQAAGFQDALGVDRHYFDGAKARSLAMLYLETARGQIDILAATPDTEWAGSLEEEIDDGAQGTIDLVTFWKAGDATNLSREVDEAATQQPGIYQALVVNRNLNWLPQIENFLSQATITIVIAGAGHFVGTNSVVMLLAARGYEVVQLPGAPPSLGARLLRYEPTVGLTNTISFPPLAPGLGPDVTLVEQTAFDLAVELSGDGRFAFQWHKDSQPIVGATNAVLRKANIRLADAGTYVVEVRGDFGSATSVGLRIGVAAPSAPRLAIARTGSTLELTLQGTTNAHYRVEFSDRLPGGPQWQTLRGIMLATSSATVTNIPLVELPTEQFYRAVYAP